MEPLIRLIRKYQGSRNVAEREHLAIEFICEVGPHLLRYLRARCRKDDARDAHQETLTGIAEGLQEFTGENDAGVWGWMYSIARNKAHDQFRGRQMRLATIVDTDILRGAVKAVHDESPFTDMERAELQEAINLLKTSSPPCVHYLWDRYVVGLTFVELGKEYEVSEEAARKRVERCLKLAQDLIGE